MTECLISRIYSDRLRNKEIFLSASFPSPTRNGNYYASARSFEITDATIAAVRAILGAGGKLLFGGHPTISPLVLSVGRDFSLDIPKRDWPYIKIYQSELYRQNVPEETLQLEQEGIGKIYWTPSVEGDTRESLYKMRTMMLKGNSPEGGIFIGGMEGVFSIDNPESEFYMFKGIRRGKPIYPIGHAGGASKFLLDRILTRQEPMDWNYKRIKAEDLSRPIAYSILMRQIVDDIIDHI